MRFWKSLLVAPLALAFACESTEERTTFTGTDAGATDAPPTPDGGGGTFDEADAGGCAPVATTERAAPKSLRAFQPGSCTTEELAGYITDCLQSAGDKCEAYKTASATCAACIESKSTDETWGPIVFYEGRTYYDYNQGGCIANVTGDLADTGCGAAQTRYLECRHASCKGCITNAFDLTPFYECQNGLPVDKTCADEKGKVQAACQQYFASGANDACQAKTVTGDAFTLQLITAWCGPSSTDAGIDAADSGM
jgi:hypothetical protein